MATVPGESPLGPLNGWVPDSTAFAYGLPGTLEPVPFFDPAGLCEGKSPSCTSSPSLRSPSPP